MSTEINEGKMGRNGIFATGWEDNKGGKWEQITMLEVVHKSPERRDGGRPQHEKVGRNGDRNRCQTGTKQELNNYTQERWHPNGGRVE